MNTQSITLEEILAPLFDEVAQLMEIYKITTDNKSKIELLKKLNLILQEYGIVKDA